MTRQSAHRRFSSSSPGSAPAAPEVQHSGSEQLHLSTRASLAQRGRPRERCCTAAGALGQHLHRLAAESPTAEFAATRWTVNAGSIRAVLALSAAVSVAYLGLGRGSGGPGFASAPTQSAPPLTALGEAREGTNAAEEGTSVPQLPDITRGAPASAALAYHVFVSALHIVALAAACSYPSTRPWRPSFDPLLTALLAFLHVDAMVYAADGLGASSLREGVHVLYLLGPLLLHTPLLGLAASWSAALNAAVVVAVAVIPALRFMLLDTIVWAVLVTLAAFVAERRARRMVCMAPLAAIRPPPILIPAVAAAVPSRRARCAQHELGKRAADLALEQRVTALVARSALRTRLQAASYYQQCVSQLADMAREPIQRAQSLAAVSCITGGGPPPHSPLPHPSPLRSGACEEILLGQCESGRLSWWALESCSRGPATCWTLQGVRT